MTQSDKTGTPGYDLMFDVQRSVRYHHRRVAFFGGLHRLAMFVSLFVALTAGVAAIQDHGIWALALSIVVALTAAVDAVADSVTKCSLHRLLSYRFQELEKKIGNWKKLDEDEKAYDSAVRERLSIEQEEPAPLRLLDVLCHYELLRSMGQPADRTPKVPLHRRLLANFVSQTEYAQQLSG